MAEKFTIVCRDCGKESPINQYLRECLHCKGLLSYQLKKKSTLATCKDPSLSPSLFLQFGNILPLDNIKGAINPDSKLTKVSRGFNIEKEMGIPAGVEVWLSDDSIQPTNSFKIREAGMTVNRLRELGLSHLVVASTGDCGAAHVYMCCKAGIPVDLFIPDDCWLRWQGIEENMRENHEIDYKLATIHHTEGNMHKAQEISLKFANDNGYTYEHFFRNQLRVEGMKTYHLEAIMQLPKPPTYYLQSVGSGVGMFSMWKGCQDVQIPVPHLIGIQPKGCAPMPRSEQNLPAQEKSDTLVMGIGLPEVVVSYKYLKQIGVEFFEGFHGGKEEELKEIPFYTRLLESDGIMRPALESLCSLIGLEHIKSRLVPGDLVLIGATGQLRRDLM